MFARFTRLAAGFSLAVIAPAVIMTTTAHAATHPDAAQVSVTRSTSPATAQPKTGDVAVNAASIPKDVTVVQAGGQTFPSAHGTEVARVVSPSYAAAKTALAKRQGNVSFVLSGQTTKSVNAAKTGTSASPNTALLSIGYACLVQTWPGTNAHPCGYVIGNPVAQGIFNALKFIFARGRRGRPGMGLRAAPGWRV